jgi:hypothetical protein
VPNQDRSYLVAQSFLTSSDTLLGLAGDKEQQSVCLQSAGVVLETLKCNCPKDCTPYFSLVKSLHKYAYIAYDMCMQLQHTDVGS